MSSTKLSEIDFNELDIQHIGSWPTPVKALLVGVLSLLVLAGGYSLIISDQIRHLEAEIRKERELKNTYRIKYSAAVNLDAHKAELVEMEAQFDKLLKRLPATHETPGLLDDITYIGTTSGLSFEKLHWKSELIKEFYTELPIQIEVRGNYHDFGIFLSKLAALPRIVLVGDFTVSQIKDSEQLHFELVAQTYRYHEAAK